MVTRRDNVKCILPPEDLKLFFCAKASSINTSIVETGNHHKNRAKYYFYTFFSIFLIFGELCC